MTAILRDSNTVTCLVSNVEANSESIDFRDFSSGVVLFKATPGATTIHVSDDDVTYYKLVDDTGSDVTFAGAEANEAVAFPDGLFAAHFVKFVQTSASEQTCTVLLKG